jgi:mannose-6-phosphate isomerase
LVLRGIALAIPLIFIITMQSFLVFKPLYQDRIWGGTALAEALGHTLPDGRKIGESWEIVDRPEAQSVVDNGSLAGQSLRAVIAREPAAVMGPNWPATRPFPILVKWLDCNERLSLQVHPPASVAPSLGGEPKTENWYVAHARADAQLIVGFKQPTTPEAFTRAMQDGTLDNLVNRVPVKAGDSVLVHSGQIHAIDSGNLILEIQQNSDTTYRVSDWGRVDAKGKPRELHLAQSMRSILWDAPAPRVLAQPAAPAVLAEAKEFRIVKTSLAAGATLAFAAGEQPRILSVLCGVLVTPEGERITAGANALIPYAASLHLTATAPTEVLVTDRFAA